MKNNWQLVEFEECLNSIPRYTKIPKKEFLEKGQYPIISQEKDLVNGYWDNEDDIFKIQKPVVIFGDHTKIVKYIDFDFAVGADGVKIFEPKKEINTRFFAFALQNIKLDDLGYARHYRLLKESKIPIPPLSEQQAIVKKLNAAFELIDHAKANIEKNIQNAKELFQSKLNEVFSQKGDGWEERKLDEVTIIKGRIGYRGYTKEDLVNKGEGAITLSPSNIVNNRFHTNNCTYISWFKYEESPEIMVFDGDILFVKTGSTYGKVAIVENLSEKATINPQFVVLKNIKINNKFLFYSLTTKIFKEKVESIVGGTATPTLSQTNLGNLTIYHPNLETQQEIVAQLDELSAKTEQLQQKYQQKLANLEELRKSILEKAFKGELV